MLAMDNDLFVHVAVEKCEPALLALFVRTEVVGALHASMVCAKKTVVCYGSDSPVAPYYRRRSVCLRQRKYARLCCSA